jgi:hypothetical protein
MEAPAKPQKKPLNWQILNSLCVGEVCRGNLEAFASLRHYVPSLARC